jgi:hypothetical protein
MPNRTANVVSVVFVGILAGIPLTTISRSETIPADNCLIAPKSDTPAGSHWYYRIDHRTKRQCWYLRGEGDKPQTASQSTAPSAKPPAPPAETVAQRSLADAHAELPTQTIRNDIQNVDPPPVASGLSPSRPNASDNNAAPAVVASRWPDTSAAIPPASPQPAASNPASDAPTNSIAPLASADLEAAPIAADFPSQRERGAMPLLVATIGVLTLACGLIAKFIRPRRPKQRKFRTRRGPTWELTDDDRIVLSDDPGINDLRRRPAFSRGAGQAGARRGDSYSRRSGRALN